MAYMWHGSVSSFLFCLQVHVYNLIQPKFGSIHFPAQQPVVSQRKWKFEGMTPAARICEWDACWVEQWCTPHTGTGYTTAGLLNPMRKYFNQNRWLVAASDPYTQSMTPTLPSDYYLSVFHTNRCHTAKQENVLSEGINWFLRISSSRKGFCLQRLIY